MKLKKMHTQKEEFRAETLIPLHYKTDEEWSKFIEKLNLIYAVTIQELPPVDSYLTAIL